MADRITTVVSTKGQVILPKAIRDQRHWAAGTQLVVEDTPEGVLLTTKAPFPETTIDAVFGCVKYEGPALSLDAMEKAVSREAKLRARR